MSASALEAVNLVENSRINIDSFMSELIVDETVRSRYKYCILKFKSYGGLKDGVATEETMVFFWLEATAKKLRGGLDFSVALNGRSRTNTVRCDLYDRFETLLSR